MSKSDDSADEYELVQHDEITLSAEDISRIREWLEPTDYLAESGEFRRHLKSQAPGTGLWICETEEYQKWHDSADHSSLWIKGIPGAGKSVIAAALVQHLKTTENCPVVFFFFRNIVAANFSPRALMQDWLAQLLPYSSRLQFALQSRLNTNLSATSLDDLFELFLDALSNVPKVYCIGDALDEMSTDNQTFLNRLNDLISHHPQSLKLLITSRPKQHLQRALYTSSIVHISLQQKLVNADIVSYLNHKFDQYPPTDPRHPIKQQIINMVATRADGLFLYAKLTMDQLQTFMTVDAHIDITLIENALPVGLENTYTSILAKQRQEYGVDMDLQKFILQTVTHSSRPLRLYELATLIQHAFPAAVAPQGFKALIPTACGPLIEILEDETLQVIHHSFTEFLRGDNRQAVDANSVDLEFPIIRSVEAHRMMAINCLGYLQSGSLLLDSEVSGEVEIDLSVTYQRPCDRFVSARRSRFVKKQRGQDKFDYLEARLRHPFLKYAVESWSYHASYCGTKDDGIFNTVTTFIDPNSLPFRRWLVLQWGTTSINPDGIEGIPTALHIAAYAGMFEVCRDLIHKDVSVSILDAQGRTPLHWAAANGHTTVVSLLLECGSEPKAVDECGLQPIHLAAQYNHASVVVTLLQAGVEPNAAKTKGNPSIRGVSQISMGQCPIYYATMGGHMETITAMIPFCSPVVLEQLLCESCFHGRTEAVLAILDRPDVSSDAMFLGATALYFACYKGSRTCVEALINHGAQTRKLSALAPSRRSGSFEKPEASAAPLHRLIQSWTRENDSISREIFQILIKSHADLEQLDGNGNTVLHLAILSTSTPRGEGTSVFKTLLSAGANPTQLDRSGLTAFHILAKTSPNVESIDLFLKHGCDPNQPARGGKTVFQYALQRLEVSQQRETTADIVRLMLNHGANPEIQDESGRIALQDAVSAECEILAEVLLHCRNNWSKTKTWFSLVDQHEENLFRKNLDLLQAEGLHIDTRDDDGRTLYLCCLSASFQRQILRSKGAKADAIDNDGNNAFHIAAKHSGDGYELLPAIMAEEELDPLSRNNDGDTLLHHIAACYDVYHTKCVKELFDLGIPVGAVNKNGQTALHVYLQMTPLIASVDPSWRRRSANAIPHTSLIYLLKDNPEFAESLEIRIKNDLTALHLAAMRSEIEFSNLVAVGADVDALTKTNQSVLHLAARTRQPNIIGFILQNHKSVQVDKKDAFGRTALHYACSSGDIQSVEHLLNHGANVHAIDLEGRTCLHACAEFSDEKSLWRSHDERYRWFQDSQENPLRPRRPPRHNVRRDSSGPWSNYKLLNPRPYFYETFYSSMGRIVAKLLEAGIDVSCLDKSSWTALDVAIDGRCAEFTEVFVNNELLLAESTKHLQKQNPKAFANVEEGRLWMKTQMTLMRPRSRLDILRQTDSSFSQVLSSPTEAFSQLISSDVCDIVNERLKLDQFDPSLYTALKELMKPCHLQHAERIPSLLRLCSSYSYLRAMLNQVTQPHDRRNHTPAQTALQIACEQLQPNISQLRHLVGNLQIDVNAHGVSLIGPRSPLPSYGSGRTALHVLASADSWWQIEAIEYLIANGATIDSLDENGATPLHIAAQGPKYQYEREVKGFWRLEAMRVLLRHGADPNFLDNRGLAPLHKASTAVTRDFIDVLISHGGDVNIGARSPLFDAIEDKNVTTMEALLDLGVSANSCDESILKDARPVVNWGEDRKRYALLATTPSSIVFSEDELMSSLFRTLIERGASLYLPLNENETLLHFLFESSNYYCIDTLLKEPLVSRIDFRRRDQLGRTVLMAACSYSRIASLDGYHDPKASAKIFTPVLHKLNLDDDLTLVDNDGKTALHHLLQNTQMPEAIVMEFLVQHDVDYLISVKDVRGISLWQYALRNLRPDVCEWMLSKGANLLEGDPTGRTLLHHIADNEAGHRLYIRRFNHSDKIHYESCFKWCLHMWAKFIAQGGSINVTDNEGNTPLLVYLSSQSRCDNWTEIYNSLFPSECGVDFFATNNAGETALHAIAKRKAPNSTYWGEKELFELMLAKGVDPLKYDSQGRSAIDIASAYNKTHITEILARHPRPAKADSV